MVSIEQNSISSMVQLFGLDRGPFRDLRRPLLRATGFCRRLLLIRLDPSDLLDCRADPVEPAADIRQIDQCKQQTRNPENMHMREKRQQSQNRDNLELKLMATMCNSFRKSVQSQK